MVNDEIPITKHFLRPYLFKNVLMNNEVNAYAKKYELMMIPIVSSSIPHLCAYSGK